MIEPGSHVLFYRVMNSRASCVIARDAYVVAVDGDRVTIAESREPGAPSVVVRIDRLLELPCVIS